MAYRGSDAYDQDEFFERFLSRRNRDESPNNLMERPAILELLDDVKGRSVLDLGCGDGRFGLELFQRGTRLYTGVEGSLKMVDRAKEVTEGFHATIDHTSLEEWQPAAEQTDVVVSRMVFHYIEDLRSVFEKVASSLKPGGQFLFSVQHPVLTSSIESAEAKGKRGQWIVDDYFRTGKREEPWIGESVVKFHRTIEAYVSLAARSGFVIEGLSEAEPKEDMFQEREEYERRQRIPLFLILSCRKEGEHGIKNDASIDRKPDL
ncbi:methyltransferase domain-containing protein [Halobacillus litoralis]|uniref:class I SAM-dependent DNA methyltransferase n=1 Tax=Halobacillus litoralis TaxID=45668 RepID=UPI001CD1AF42|nr:class I SAM-dependent methyltransferase [Halobacillus litoralis]MCA0970201.1 methyltransferase domain-containing protein [Halobacillus litoralis]